MIAYGAHRARQALNFLSSEVRGLQAAAYVLAAFALLSSLLALVRDRLLAHMFGAGTILDIYYAGFRMPDLIFVATGALVSVYMLIPELSRRSAEGERDYIDSILFSFSIFAVIVSGVAAIIAPYILVHLFPDLAARGLLPDVVLMTRIMLLQPIFLGLSNIFAAVTQSRHRYTLYSLSPLIYNLSIIFGVIFFYPFLGIGGLAWGVVLGSVLHAGIQVPSLFADGFLHRLPRLRERAAVLKTAALSVPRALALSMSQLSFLGLVALAGLLPAGSIAVFMFGYNLQAVPLAIIGASYSVAAFPTLSKALAAGNTEEFIGHVATATRYVLFWSLPASALMLVLRAQIVRVILGSGSFDWTDTRLTAAAFALFGFSLASQGVVLLLARGYYAAGRTFVPFAVAALVAALTLAFGAGMIFLSAFGPVWQVIERVTRVQDLVGTAVVGLPFSYALASIIGSVILVVHFERTFPGYLRRVASSFVDALAAAIVGGAAAYVFLEIASSFTVPYLTLAVFVQGASAGICGILMIILTYFGLESPEFNETVLALRARLWRKPQADVLPVASAEQ